MKKYFIATLSKTYRVTIPKEIRKLLNIEPEENVLFVMENNEVELKGVPKSNTECLAGSLKKFAKNYVDLKTVRKKIGTQIAEEIAQERIESK
jgi:AbrB family looped-hinge helix DNA binding protein